MYYTIHFMRAAWPVIWRLSFQNSIIYKRVPTAALKHDTNTDQPTGYRRRRDSLPEQHAPGILDVLLDLNEESDSLTTIQKTVVVCESEIHHLFAKVSTTRRGSSMRRGSYRADFNLAVDGHGLVLDGVETQNS
jgi:hypothetical protein